MRSLRVGDAALLVEVAGTDQALDLAGWAREHRLAVDVVPGAETVLLDGVADLDRVAAVLGDWEPSGEPARGRIVELPTTYDGADLEAVAGHWGCDVAEVVRRHRETEFVSAFCGFAPGFAYLTGLSHAVPRLETPRTRVPAGSVALADRWCGVYPQSSPGGWLLIGRTDVRLWDAEAEPPAVLAPGTRVRFVDA